MKHFQRRKPNVIRAFLVTKLTMPEIEDLPCFKVELNKPNSWSVTYIAHAREWKDWARCGDMIVLETGRDPKVMGQEEFEKTYKPLESEPDYFDWEPHYGCT